MAKDLNWIGEIFPPAAERSFDIELWDGTILAPAGAPRRDIRVIFRRKKAFKKVLFTRSAFEAGRAYVNGDIDITGDISAVFRELAEWGHTIALPWDKKLRWGVRLLLL